MAAAAITLMIAMTVLTSCTSRNDRSAERPSQGEDPTPKLIDVSALLATWYTDTFDKVDAEQKAHFEEWSRMDLIQVTPTPTK